MPRKGNKKRVVDSPLVMIGDIVALEGDVDTEVRVYGQVAIPQSVDIVVPFHTEPNTASADDYIEVENGELVIGAGDLVGYASITILGDQEVEGYESFRIVFGEPAPSWVRLQNDPLIRHVVIFDDDV
jgi:hypothetical protein